MDRNKHELAHRREHPFNRLARSFFGDDLGFFLEDGFAPKSHHPNISLSEDDTHVYIEAALAGLTSEEIDVTMENGVVWIRGSKKEKEDQKKYHYRAERSYSYKLALPESVNEASEPKAKYENGILFITFEKAKKANPKKISIQ